MDSTQAEATLVPNAAASGAVVSGAAALNTEPPLISIVVPVYNHAAYIERCLRGILMQKCDFSYEVWIGEDCSPDNTREVMRAIQPEFPENFHFLYREKNSGGQNSSDLLNRCTGKYLCICEGDDFWTYDSKLQEQAEFMEAHPEYMACYHHCTVVGEDSEPNGEKYPECWQEDYTFKEYFYCTMPGQTATSFSRREEYAEQKRIFLTYKQFNDYPDDRRNSFLLLTAGKVKVFQETWSAYRHVVKPKSTSYSSTLVIDEAYAQNEVNFGKTLVAYAEGSGNPAAIEAAKETYYRLLLKWSVGKVKVAKLGASLREVMAEPRGLHYLLGVPRWYFVLVMRQLRGRGVNL